MWNNLRLPLSFGIAGGLLGFGVALAMPVRYSSQGTIKIGPPTNWSQSKEALAREEANRVARMTERVLSRNSLEAIIAEAGLYPRERTRMPMEEVTNLMRRDIQVLPIRLVSWGSAFDVQYANEDPQRALRVVQSLISRFIDENIRDVSEEGRLHPRERLRPGGDIADVVAPWAFSLELLEPANLPDTSVVRNWLFAVAGLLIGLLAGGLVLKRQLAG